MHTHTGRDPPLVRVIMPAMTTTALAPPLIIALRHRRQSSAQASAQLLSSGTEVLEISLTGPSAGAFHHFVPALALQVVRTAASSERVSRSARHTYSLAHLGDLRQPTGVGGRLLPSAVRGPAGVVVLSLAKHHLARLRAFSRNPDVGSLALGSQPGLVHGSDDLDAHAVRCDDDVLVPQPQQLY